MAKALMIVGIVLFLTGLVWHWRGSLGLGSLPGDFVFKRGNFSFYFPLTTSLLLSVLLSLISWLLRR